MYIPQAWVDEATDLSAARFNHMEAGISQAEKRAILVPSTTGSGSFDEATAVRWDNVDGAMVAGIMTAQQGVAPNRSSSLSDFLDAEAGGTGFASRSQQARVTVGGQRRAANLTLSATPALRSVIAQADPDTGASIQRKVIDSAGASDFYTPSPWYDCQAVFGTNYSAGTNPTNDWIHVMVRKVQPDKVEIRGLFKMGAASVAGGNSREAFRFDNITALGNLNPARYHMLTVMAENHTMNRFDVAPNSPYITWTEGSGVNTGWFWIRDEWFLT